MARGIAIDGKRSLRVRAADRHHLAKGAIRDT
jgi:hypothetical protein